MDRLTGRTLVMAVALAFAGTGAFAHGTKQATADVAGSGTASADSSVKGTSSDVVTAADAATTPNYSGNMGVQSTPGAADEDQNDEGGARGKSATAPHGKRLRHHKHAAAPAASAGKDTSEIANDKSSSAATNPNIQPQNSNASPPASETAVSPSTATTR